MILSATSCSYATHPRIAHWSVDKKVNKALEYAEQAWAEAGVNFDRIDANALIRLTKKYTEDYCEDAADRKYPNRSLY